MKYLYNNDNSNIQIKLSLLNKSAGKWYANLFRISAGVDNYKHHYGFSSFYFAFVIFGINIITLNICFYKMSRKYRRKYMFSEMETAGRIITFSQVPIKGVFSLQEIETNKKKDRAKLIYNETYLKINNTQALWVRDKKTEIKTILPEVVVSHYHKEKSLKL